MSDQHHSGGGLAGTMSRAASSLKSTVRNQDGWAIRLVFWAGIITIIHKASSSAQPWSVVYGVHVPPYAVAFATMLGIAALLYEMNAATYALRHFWRGSLFGMLGWAAVWCVAFAYSLNQWVGAASESEGAKSNTHKAAYTRTVDTRDALTASKLEYDRLQRRMSWFDTAINGQPVRSIVAAEASINNAKAHKFWKTTDECKETKGPQTRQFCAEYTAFLAEKSLATEKELVSAELLGAKVAYDKAKAGAAAAPTETSEARNDLIILTRYGGMTENDARVANALGSIIAISIFLSLATMLREWEHLRASGARTPFVNWSGVAGAVRSVLFGDSTPRGTKTIVHTRTVLESRSASAAYKAAQMAT